MADTPNSLVLWGADSGWYDFSHDSCGAMGYQAPNIDRIARGGVEFTSSRSTRWSTFDSTRARP